MSLHLKRPQPHSAAAVFTLLLIALGAPASAADRATERGISAVAPNIQNLRLERPVAVEGFRLPSRGVLDSSLIGKTGQQKVIVRLRTDAVASMQNALSGEQLGRKSAIQAEQSSFMARCQAAVPSVRELARTQLVLNAVFIQVDAAALPTLARDPAVLRIGPINNYTKDLAETVPYIGAAAVQAAGIDGSGVRVAVLDSGIDYYHANLGGSGDPAEYAADDPSIIEPGTFPTAKVVDGFDFVGSTWPNTDEIFDEDPLDDGPGAGHGTNVSDIIGGGGGVAPGVGLVAVKVCSSITTGCSGLALILGMEFAVDPNGDGDPEDAVDVINMSLGSPYGQPFDDDLAAAVDNATRFGVLTVASAGNSGDKPYVTGTPSSARTALSVAQTQVPSANLQLISVDGFEVPAVFQPWAAPLTTALTGPFQYADGAGGNLNGCLPFAPDSLAGLIVLVDRGACNFTSKIFNVANAGGLAGIIGLVAPGAPFSGGFADPGGPITVPGYMISQADANAVRGGISATIDPANQLPLVMQVVGSSSRGPRNFDSMVKPEIGAPGASVSAAAGTGTGEVAFGGTSGAAPMVSGSAALLLDRFPYRRPHVIRSMLVDTAESNIATDPFQGLAPITRIGGGEVRVDRALRTRAVAYDRWTRAAALNFGFVDVDNERITLKGELIVRNLTWHKLRFHVTPVFRFANDEMSGAVHIDTRSHLKVNRGAWKKLKVKMIIDGTALPPNAMSSGAEGANPDTLTLNEFDGYLVLDDGVMPLEIPWHVLPRQAAKVQPDHKTFKGGATATVLLDNKGVGIAQNDAYSLLAVSRNIPEGNRGEQSPTPDIRAVGVNTIPVPPGFCSADASFLWLFATNTWERQTHALPVSNVWYLDTNQDGTDDFAVLNRDLSGLGTIADGRQVSYAVDLQTGTAQAFFFTEHATNTGNMVHIICAEQVGLTGADLLTTNVGVAVSAEDFYYGGPGDLVEGLVITPFGEQFVGTTADIDPGATDQIDIEDFGVFPGNSPELGVLLFTNGDRGAGARGGATQRTEALVLGVKGANVRAARYPRRGHGYGHHYGHSDVSSNDNSRDVDDDLEEDSDDN